MILRVKRATHFSSLGNRCWARLKRWDSESHRQCQVRNVMGSWPSASEEGRTIKGSHRQPKSRSYFGGTKEENVLTGE